MTIHKTLLHTHYRRAGFNGKGFIAGQLTVNGQAAARKVSVYHNVNGVLFLVTQLFSAEDGSYRIDFLNENKKYIVIAYDNQGLYEPVIYENVTPALENGS